MKLFKLKDPLSKTWVSLTYNENGMIGIRTYVIRCDNHAVVVLQERESEPTNRSLFEVW